MNLQELLSLAQDLYGREEYDSALQYFQQARAMAPNDSSISVSIGRIFMDKGDFAFSKEWLVHARTLNSENEDAHF